jgi:hypothetical protein
MFLIQGLYSPDDDASFYWSNDEGWVMFEDATRFEDEDLKVIAFPMESIGVVMLDEDGNEEDSITIEDIWKER